MADGVRKVHIWTALLHQPAVCATVSSLFFLQKSLTLSSSHTGLNKHNADTLSPLEGRPAEYAHPKNRIQLSG
jgi:hypothetical protein